MHDVNISPEAEHELDRLFQKWQRKWTDATSESANDTGPSAPGKFGAPVGGRIPPTRQPKPSGCATSTAATSDAAGEINCPWCDAPCVVVRTGDDSDLKWREWACGTEGWSGEASDRTDECERGEADRGA